MRRSLFIMVIIPQIAFSQFDSKEFVIPDTENQEAILFDMSVSNEDTTIYINCNTAISGLFVSGTTILSEKSDSYVRITLKDFYDYEYLVYEAYPLLCGVSYNKFSQIGMETAYLKDIYARSINIECQNATIRVDSIYFVSGNNSPNNSIRQNQSDYIARRLNNNLAYCNGTWKAEANNITQMTFEEKKSLFGGKVPMLYGFDYYRAGVFVMPGFDDNQYIDRNVNSISTNSYIPEWDWRIRHGKNWMTSVKDQGSCAACWAFSVIGTFEAYINLYYNQLINYDLSEQELISCAGSGGCSGTIGSAMRYLENIGVASEACFPYMETVVPCSDKCINPDDALRIANHNTFSSSNANIIKQSLFKMPHALTILSWNHSMTLVGYKQIEGGGYYSFCNSQGCDSLYIFSDSPLVGQTAWLVKNSWGTSWGDNGYGYVVFSLSDMYPSKLIGAVSSQVLSDDDIVCEDADGDGFFNWGIGPKPSSCPSWVPDEEDGDDSDYTKGPLDNYGYCMMIDPDGFDTIFINNNTTYSSYNYNYRHILVQNNSTLTVTNRLLCNRGVSITVKSGSTLRIIGGEVRNVILKLESGCNLIMSDGARIIHNSIENFEIPIGVRFLQNYGSIE